MKKIAISLPLLLTFVPVVMGASVNFQFKTTLNRFEAKDLNTLIVSSASDNEITAENDIIISLEPEPDYDPQVRWYGGPEFAVVASGEAVDNGKIDQSPTISITEDRLNLRIDVLQDLDQGESFEVDGLSLLSYGKSSNDGDVALDFNGNTDPSLFNPEYIDKDVYKVESNTSNDNLDPFPLIELNHEFNDDGDLVLDWESVDLDYDMTNIIRTLYVGETSEEQLVYDTFETSYTESSSNLVGYDRVMYELYAVDDKNHVGESIFLEILLAEPQNDPEPEVAEDNEPNLDESQNENSDSDDVPFEIPPIGEPDDSFDPVEIEMLESLLDYYVLRYTIHCNSAYANEDRCLISKIMLSYAWERTGGSLVDGVSTISQADLDEAVTWLWSEFSDTNQCLLSSATASNAESCESFIRLFVAIDYFQAQLDAEAAV